MADAPTPGEAEAAMLRGFRGDPEPGLALRITGNRLVVEGAPELLAEIARELEARAAPPATPTRVVE